MPSPLERESQLPLDVTWSRPAPLVERRQADRRHGGRRWTDAEARMRLECPHCGDMYSLAVPHHQTAAEQLTDAFWRRRRCDSCYRIYPTTERVGNVRIDDILRVAAIMRATVKALRGYTDAEIPSRAEIAATIEGWAGQIRDAFERVEQSPKE